MSGRVVKAITQCVRNEVELFELNEELVNDDVVTFDLAESIKKLIEQLKQRIKCSLTAVEGIVGEGELRGVYKKFRADLEALLKNDAKHCLEVKGVIEKLK